MLELNWAPLIGACVVRRQSWEKIPADTRKLLLEASLVAGKEIKANGRQESAESVKAMEKRGLKVTPVTSEIEAAWRAEAEAVYPRIRGRLVPPDVFDEAQRLIKEYRGGQTK
jgi:TRAP-type C4-dicarboxylate transport system substrate-binding protein